MTTIAPLLHAKQQAGAMPMAQGLRISGSGVAILDALSALFRRAALHAGAVERGFPTLISGATLRRAGEFESFPGRSISVDCGEYFLPPVLCHHCYEAESSRVLPAETVITCAGRCFRNELPDDLHLREFGMREVVFFGDDSFVSGTWHVWMDIATSLAAEIGIKAVIRNAADPFFGSAHRGRRLLQQVAGMKKELCALLETSGSLLPLASFNLHGQFFTKSFDITLASGAAAFSGCVGFGMERWLFALLRQRSIVEALERLRFLSC